jgi:hypothetical protein
VADTAPSNTPSVVERTRVIAAGAPVVAAHFLGRTAALVLGEEAVLLVPDKGDEQRLTLHGGGILSAATDGVFVITGGDDGKVFSTDVKGELADCTDAKRRWTIMSRPVRRRGGVVGRKQAFAQAGKAAALGEVQSTVGGLPRAEGRGLAIAHYNGVSMWFPNPQAAPEMLSGRARTTTSRSARTGSSW